MKLLRRLKDVEERRRRAERNAALAGSGVGLVWTSSESMLSDAELAAAPHVALDAYITGEIAEVITWRTVQRATEDERDRGNVYDVDGQLIGHVVAVERDGRLVTWRPIKRRKAEAV